MVIFQLVDLIEGVRWFPSINGSSFDKRRSPRVLDCDVLQSQDVEGIHSKPHKGAKQRLFRLRILCAHEHCLAKEFFSSPRVGRAARVTFEPSLLLHFLDTVYDLQSHYANGCSSSCRDPFHPLWQRKFHLGCHLLSLNQPCVAQPTPLFRAIALHKPLMDGR
jgi:hypothetical protein